MTGSGEAPSHAPVAPIPLTVLTGFLGAGKTTLLNRLVRDPALADAAVLINEFGEVGLDHLLVDHVADDGLVMLTTGCLCCTMRGNLVAALEKLLRGLDNGRIAFRRDGVVTVVDAVNATRIPNRSSRPPSRIGWS